MRTRAMALSAALGRGLGHRRAGHATRKRTTPQRPTRPFTVPRTSWGDPDLQGVWDYRTITPMERRPELGDREFYTDEEIAQLEGRAARRMEQPPDAERAGQPRSRRIPDGSGPPRRRVAPHVADRRSAERPHAGADGCRARTASRQARATGGRRRARRSRGLLYRPHACSSAASRADPRAHRCPRSTTTTSASSRRRPTSRSSTRWCTRRVSCRSTAAPFSNVRSYMGESRGRWEGDTLVVETRNFNGKAPFRGAGDNLRVIERYTRAAPGQVDFKVTFEDDTQWTQPWTAAYSMLRPKASCTSTRATKATMGCATSSRMRATKSARARRSRTMRQRRV